MVALVGSHASYDPTYAGKTFQGSRMNLNIVEKVTDSPEAVFRIFQRYSPDYSMNSVSLFEQKFRQIGTILSRNPCDQRRPLIHRFNPRETLFSFFILHSGELCEIREVVRTLKARLTIRRPCRALPFNA
jgi:hypothetical protein